MTKDDAAGSQVRSNVLLDKSFAFAVRIVRLSRYLREQRCEAELVRQLLRSGTAIGANAEEAAGGISKAEFSQKIGIAYKEARETSYWLRLLREVGSLEPAAYESLQADCDELCRISRAILNSTRENRRAAS
ncbi:four helix bundle protein [Hymenobacter oligotrophus]|uniref:Four helix bundle protein n=1 Tax=Hymenobacter oligotrophus TaxID=2319843 RepID=A0A3B7RBM6_9BACT|nr:four helix bundle protein [Hymenobacter oligotrophus]AYA38099.1 four helix bundle protein [Hymenobacter oligotrophus]